MAATGEYYNMNIIAVMARREQTSRASSGIRCEASRAVAQGLACTMERTAATVRNSTQNTLINNIMYRTLL